MEKQVNFDIALNTFREELFLYRKNSIETVNLAVRANEFTYPFGKQVRMSLQQRIGYYSNFFVNYGNVGLELIIKNLIDFKCHSLTDIEIKALKDTFQNIFLNEVLHLRNKTLTAQYQGFPPENLSDWHFMQGFDRKATDIFTRLDIAIKKFNANNVPPVPEKISILNPNNKYFNLFILLSSLATIISLLIVFRGC